MYDVLLSPVMRETLHRQINDYSFNCKNYILQAVWSSTQAEQPQLSCGGPIEYGRYKNVAPRPENSHRGMPRGQADFSI
jgi:hypothetical protein